MIYLAGHVYIRYMEVTIQIDNCENCPCSDSFSDYDSLMYCQIMLDNIVKEGKTCYYGADLYNFPTIPDNCPLKEHAVKIMKLSSKGKFQKRSPETFVLIR